MKKHCIAFLHTLLSTLAKKWVTKHQPIVIGGTGSVGKTSSRMVMYRVLQEVLPEKQIYTSPKNFNSEIGIVLSLFQIESYSPTFVATLLVLKQMLSRLIFSSKPYDIILLEYGIDHPGDMQFLTDIVQPDYSLFTKLDAVHGEYFDNIHAIGDEKFILMQRTKIMTYLNASDEYCKNIGAPALEQKDVSIQWYNGDGMNITGIHIGKRGNALGIEFDRQDTHVMTNLLGEENANYINIALDLGQRLGAKKYKKNISLEFELQPGRSHIFHGICDSVIIDSSYNAAPASMQKMIETTKALRESCYPGYGIICVLGDMRELGDYSQQAHKDIAGYLDGVDYVCTIGPEMQQYLDIKNKQSFLSARKAGQAVKEYLSSTDKKYIILVKGSQNTIFSEEAVKEILAHSDDMKQLVRQDQSWLKKKKKFFERIEK
ncbi:hypothetical protein MK079_04955 [Candidatus Gracilibacteria bacterium]|nr:hypothetical protein [Candidatus Gracilibacteria bacterium]